MSGYNRCGKILVCDDLISEPPIDQLLAEKIPESPNAKVISGTLGEFDVNELQEVLRKRIEAERNMDWEILLPEPFESKGKPYRCICYNEDITRYFIFFTEEVAVLCRVQVKSLEMLSMIFRGYSII